MVWTRPKFIAAATLAGIVVAGTVGYVATRAPDEGGKPAAAAAAGGPGRGGPGRGGPTKIVAVPAVEREFALKIEALGSLEPRERVELTANTPDRVTGVYFEDGQRVKKGAVLVRLVNDEEQALLDASKASLEDADRVLERNQRLYAEGAVSTLEYQRSQRDRDSAAATVRSLEARLADRVVRAPFNGVLGFRKISNGAYVSPGQVVATLIDDSEMRLEFTVPSIHLNELKEGLQLTARTDDMPGREFNGTLTSIDNAIDPVTRSVKARATLPNTDGELKTGMFMTVDLRTEPRTSLSAPEIAVVAEGAKTFVYIADTSAEPAVARKQEVTLGAREKGVVEVLSGLTAGDLVVTDGVLKLRPNAPVQVQAEPPPQGSALAEGDLPGGNTAMRQ
ncbi:MAG: efflux RND transporter periplasmic adaptor subunit [Hyphomonadaceae bacterium]